MTGQRLIRVDDAVFDQAVQNVIRLTGAGSLDAQWLVQAALAPALLAPKKLMLNAPDEYYEPSVEIGPVPGADCPYAYLRQTGEVILCNGPCPHTPPEERGEHHPDNGWHEGPIGTMTWHESNPRSVNILQWRGETA